MERTSGSIKRIPSPGQFRAHEAARSADGVQLFVNMVAFYSHFVDVQNAVFPLRHNHVDPVWVQRDDSVKISMENNLLVLE